MSLKQQDIYVILKILSQPGERWSYVSLSESLRLSPSETNAAVKRAIQCGLMRPAFGTESNPQPMAAALLEFLAHGIRYVFPIQPGGLTRGVATGFAAPGLQMLMSESDEHMAVWPWAGGDCRGYAMSPLFRRAPEAVQDHPQFHAMLALTDVLRQSSPRGREVAIMKLKGMIERNG
ncbi:MAG: hypothetical protein IPH48_13600 [bacterium]|jgi:hypothetical protein|nr:hypothetical protein [bacterium]MBK9777514.1 hypothetical protein [bacterium]